jgi:SAM-dependent methyltransferase
MKRELLLGCGNSRVKKVTWTGSSKDFENLTTLDIDQSCEPDVVWDMNKLPYPFEQNTFDEIHAYECLEHCGKQGDWRFFFDQFTEFHRILKSGGMMVATVPMWDSAWAWGDPGHTRVITKGSLIFLDQREYVQVGETPITDYRPWYKADFERMSIMEETEMFGFILKAIKGEERHTPQVVSDRR